MSSLEQLHLEIASAVSAIFEKHVRVSRSPLAETPRNPRVIFLKEWRHSRAKVEGVRHYRIFSNRTLNALAETPKPRRSCWKCRALVPNGSNCWATRCSMPSRSSEARGDSSTVIK